MVVVRRERQPGGPEGFEAVYVGDDEVERRVPWACMPGVLGELGPPVRSFPSVSGSAEFPGLVLVGDGGPPDRLRVVGGA